jgi:endonuclease YncB( thermonuclease family)
MLSAAGALGVFAGLLGVARADDTPAPPAETATPPATRCTLQPGPTRAVSRVIDGETIELDDKTQVRLIGALAPRPPLGLAETSAAAEWKPEADARAALHELVAGRTVELAFGARQKDRYGRLLAHVFTIEGGVRTWVQGEIVARGHARAYGLPQSFECAAELVALEMQAREAGLGLWADANYAPRRAGDVPGLRRLRGSYQLVVGKILEARQTKSVLYLNFGPGRSRDFSGVVPLAHADRAWTQGLAALAGKTVLVRGWLERKAGPFIQIDDATQIEVLPDGSGPRDVVPGARQSVSAAPGSGNAESPAADTRRGAKRKRPARGAPGAVDL